MSKKSERTLVSRKALRDIATTLTLALEALEGDEVAVRVYEYIELTPEQVIRNQAYKLRIMANGITELHKIAQEDREHWLDNNEGGIR